MTAVAAPAQPAGGLAAPAESSLASDLQALVKRSVTRTLRQPAVIIPSLFFPLFFLAINVGGLGSAVSNPGFPTENYLNFALATAFVQASMSALMIGGGGLSEDIHSGFLSRLTLTPTSRAAIIVGHLAGTIFIVTVASLLYLVIGLVLGGSVETGVGGAIAVIGLSVLISLAFGCLGVFAALRSKSAEAAQALFPLLLVLLFLSSQAIPRNLIEVEWFKQVASYNPMSYLIEGPRALLVVGWNGGALLRCIVICLVMIVVFLVAGSRQMQTRFART